MSSEERTKIEARLDARLEEVRRTREAMRHSGEGMRGSEPSSLDNHPGDTGSELHDEEVDETTELFLDEEEQRIAEARQALADGSYGRCRDCGQPIQPERLEAVPEAVRCISCQRRFEGGHRQRAQVG
ncbi:MAG: TraR/DksA family transcriptional regulator [Thermoleophilaceae bacterium]